MHAFTRVVTKKMLHWKSFGNAPRISCKETARQRAPVQRESSGGRSQSGTELARASRRCGASRSSEREAQPKASPLRASLVAEGHRVGVTVVDVRAFADFGNIPARTTSDNLRTAVVRILVRR
jgi:hypothetical protein